MTLQAKSEGTQMGEEADEKVKVMVEEEKSEEPKTSVEEKSMENGEDKSTKPESEEGKKIGEDDTPSSDSVGLVKKSSSFKEESNLLSDLKDHERKALIELRSKIEESIIENNLFKKEEKHKKQKQEKEELKYSESEGEKPKTQENAMPTADGKTIDEDISLWGVPLFPGKSSEGTDVVLLKFLRARDFKVKESLEMLKSTLQWRKEFKIDSILDEHSLGADLGPACYMDGLDREGHPVYYNVPGVFLDDLLYQKAFGTEESRAKFLRWRVQIIENVVKFRPPPWCLDATRCVIIFYQTDTNGTEGWLIRLSHSITM